MKRFSKFIPMAVLALGLVGALSSFTVSKDSKKLTINIPAYVKGNPLGSVCTASSLCADDGTDICTSGTGTQIWGMDGSSKCVVKLFRNHQ